MVEDSLLSLQNSKDGQWIYRLHKDEEMEVNYLHKINDEIKILIPDRVFIEDGIRWIIDYKTVFNDKDVKITKDYVDQLSLYESLFINDNYLNSKSYLFR